MTCRQAQKHLVDLFDAAPPELGELRAHLAACAECGREYGALQTAVAAIQPPVRIQASADFKERVMSKLTEWEAPARRRLVLPRFVYVAVALLLLLLLAPLAGNLGRRGRAPASVLSLLAQSAQAMANARSVHMLARMRTTPGENFEFIDPTADWVPLEIWTEAGPPFKWRVEKPGRVAVMDGTASMLVIKPDHVSRGTARANYLEWMLILLDTDQLMEKELALARSGDSTARLNGDGTLLTVDRHPRSFFSNDWVRDKAVASSDHTRIYRFDPATRRLEWMQMVMHTHGADVPVFEITEVRYDEAFDPALFALVAPANAISFVDPEEMPLASRLPQSPREAAEMLFDAFSREDWEAARVVYPATGFSPDFKKALGGLKVISIGEPFRSAFYAGWYVPYEIRLRSGYVKKWNLAVRNDNAAHRWVEDGGL